MRKKIISLLAVFLMIFTFASVSPKAAMYTNPQTTIRVGLYYGSSALPSANLQNYVGSGYYFGYYDSSRTFHQVGYTSEEKISMMKDWNMYLQGGRYYDEAPSGSYSVVGCYHVLLDEEFSSFDEAQNEANTYTRTPAFPAYYSGTYRVCVGSYKTSADAEAARTEKEIPGITFSASSKCITVTATDTAKILFEYDCGDSSSLAVMPRSSDGRKAETWFKGYRYYGAFQYTRLNSPNITVVNMVDIEDYVKGVVPSEMSASWPIEALKAQALCARTYVASHMNNHKSYGFDACATTCCQAYTGRNSADANSDRAVDETAGQYILYNDKLCQTYFFSCDGGATEASENVFSEAIPYLRAVEDPYECNVSTGFESWSYTYTNDDITWILQNKGYNCAKIVGVTPTYTDIGNIYSLKFTDANGRNWTFTKYSAGCILYSDTLGKYTRSQRFTVTDAYETSSGPKVYVNGSTTLNTSSVYAIGADGTYELDGDSITVLTAEGTEEIGLSGTQSSDMLTSGAYTVAGSGWGHNVGMSQYGAKAMANLGFKYDQIIKFYYTGVTIG